MKPKEKITRMEWNEQFKIRIRRNASIKHEHIKLELVRSILEKYKQNLYWIRVYTEYPIENELNKIKIVDIYFENIKTKEIICYEIQNNVGDEWLEATKKFYEDVENPFMKTDWVLIREKDFSNDIEEISDKIKTII